jgi:hypothetical protein
MSVTDADTITASEDGIERGSPYLRDDAIRQQILGLNKYIVKFNKVGDDEWYEFWGAEETRQFAAYLLPFTDQDLVDGKATMSGLCLACYGREDDFLSAHVSGYLRVNGKFNASSYVDKKEVWVVNEAGVIRRTDRLGEEARRLEALTTDKRDKTVAVFTRNGDQVTRAAIAAARRDPEHRRDYMAITDGFDVKVFELVKENRDT